MSALLNSAILAPTGALGPGRVANGTFAAGTDWSGTGWSIAAGQATGVSTGLPRVYTNGAAGTAAEVGHTYRITHDLVSITAGTFSPVYGGVAGATRSSPGSYSDDIVAFDTGKAKLQKLDTGTVVIDNVQVNEVF